MSFAQLALICLVAILGPALSLPRRLHVPVVIGELAVGIVLGATGLKVLDAADPTLTFLGSIGFALLMFVAGSHVPVRDPALRRGARRGVVRALAIGVIAVPLGLGIAAWFATGHGLLYAVLIASSSASIILPALEGAPLTGKSMVQMLPQIAIADAVCIVLLPLVIDPSAAARAALGSLLVLGAAAVVFLLLWWVERQGYRRRVHAVSHERGLALELRISLTVLFALAALAQVAGVSIMLAGFAFGIAVAAVGEPRRLAKQLFALAEGFFAPIFFVWLGASLDLRELAEHPSAIGLGVALGVAAVVAHGAMVVLRQPISVAMTTAAQLGVPVAAAATGTQLGLLGPGEATALLLGALLTNLVLALLSGPVARRAHAEAGGETKPDRNRA